MQEIWTFMSTLLYFLYGTTVKADWQGFSPGSQAETSSSRHLLAETLQLQLARTELGTWMTHLLPMSYGLTQDQGIGSCNSVLSILTGSKSSAEASSFLLDDVV